MEAQIALPEFARRLTNPRLVADPPPTGSIRFCEAPRHPLVGIDGVTA